MSKKGNKRKSKQLGMNHATASNRLKKMIMFQLMQELGKDICFQCGKKIEQIEELSVEHKIPWLDSDDPIGLYFDLDNIAFSHLSCNRSAARSIRRKTAKCGDISATRYKYGCRCEECKSAQAKRMRKYRSRHGETGYHAPLIRVSL